MRISPAIWLNLFRYEEKRKTKVAAYLACAGSDSCWGNYSASRRPLADLRGWNATSGMQKARTPTGGCSEESWTMGESSIWSFRVGERNSDNLGKNLVVLVFLSTVKRW